MSCFQMIPMRSLRNNFFQHSSNYRDDMKTSLQSSFMLLFPNQQFFISVIDKFQSATILQNYESLTKHNLLSCGTVQYTIHGSNFLVCG